MASKWYYGDVRNLADGASQLRYQKLKLERY